MKNNPLYLNEIEWVARKIRLDNEQKFVEENLSTRSRLGVAKIQVNHEPNLLFSQNLISLSINFQYW